MGNCTTAAPPGSERENIETIRKQQHEIDRLTSSLRKQEEANVTLKNQLSDSATDTTNVLTPLTISGHTNQNITEFKDEGGEAGDGIPVRMDSEILEACEDQFDELSSIISRYLAETENGKIPTLRLLYRASRDGDAATNFHEHCDDKGATLTLIRDVSYNIFGGYNSLSWTSPEKPESRTQDKAFLFILKSTQIRERRICKQVPNKFVLNLEDEENQEYATQDDASKGPLFGFSDLYLDTHFCSSHAKNGSFGDYTYDMGGDERYLTPQERFSISEIEVFSVTF